MSDNLAATQPSVLRIPVVAGLRPLLLLVGLAAAIAAGVGIALWSQGPNYSLLFGNLSDAAAAQVTQSLDQSGIHYKMQHGAVLVPAEKVDEARMSLAAKGLPGSSDFTLLDKDPGFGVSQFMENARYQHALEGELARTISSLKAVEGARVHLAVPQQSAFVRDRKPVSASVFLQLRSGERLDQEQVDAIVNLVASSIPELDAGHVTVVDSSGRLLSSPEKDAEAAARDQQLELAHRIEDEYSQRIVSLLSPLLGPDRVRAQVVAQLDTASTEEAREQYKPDSQVVRSEQTSEETTHGGAGAQGVPGALTNQPPQGGTALPAGAKPAAAPAAATANAANATAGTASEENSSRQATRNYEIDRTLAYTHTPAGRITRLSAAVVIDNLRTTDKSGKVTETPLTQDQITRLTQLVRDAVGYDEARGDRVTVVNQSFLPETTAVPEIETTPVWQNPLLRDVAKILSGLVIIALLLLFVVKPLVRGLTTPVAPVLVTGAPPQAGVTGDLPAASPAASRPGNAIAYEQQIAQARSLVAKDPARVAQVVKDWVQKDD
ncbi:MAG TPA: flagellar basal-body MS-ring/collar protein FliF [Steroidobacteraceae bacterium]|nr:flagellar basal-body MS-ring/collar protein FliF [Steroidobacteraceae bacterium]